MGYEIPSRAFGDVTGSMGLYRDIGTNRATTSSAGCWATTSGAGKSREPASGYGVAGSTVVDFGSAPTKARDKVSTGPESATLALIGEVVGVHRPANGLAANLRRRSGTLQRRRPVVPKGFKSLRRAGGPGPVRLSRVLSGGALPIARSSGRRREADDRRGHSGACVGWRRRPADASRCASGWRLWHGIRCRYWR